MKLSREAGIRAGNALMLSLLLAFVAGGLEAAWALSLGRVWYAVLAAAALAGWTAVAFAAVNWLAARIETESERRARLGGRK